MINQPITIVLPMHNSEQYLQRSVREVLDLAHSFVGDFSVVIVDNGSTDETYETACELGRVYPQVTVLREPFQQGLRRVLEVVSNNCKCQTVICHDGVTAINVDQLRSLLHSAASAQQTSVQDTRIESGNGASCGSRRLGSMRSLQESMERVHGSLTGFNWMKLEEPLVPRRCFESTPTTVMSAKPNLPMSHLSSSK